MDPNAPVPEDIDRGTSFIAIFVVQCSLSIIIVALRCWARLSIHGIGWDDFFMLLTLLLFIPLTVFAVMLAVGGGTRHMMFLSEEEMLRAARLIYIAQPFGIMSVAFGKISAGFLIMRILGNTHKWMRVSIWVMILITAISNVISAITTFTQCDPPEALWNPALRPTAVCWDPSVQSNYNIFASSHNTFVDFVLALMPIRIVWGLKLNLRQRLGVVALLSVGIVSGICSAIKTAQLASLTVRSDLTWETYSLFLWVSSEIFLIVLCASVATLKPLYDRFRGKKQTITTGSVFTGSRSQYSNATSKSRTNRSRRDHVALNSFGGDMTVDDTRNSAVPDGYDGDSLRPFGAASPNQLQDRMSSDEEQGIRVTQTFHARSDKVAL
jgi:hypothetical protein